jgi:hypothetical protein
VAPNETGNGIRVALISDDSMSATNVVTPPDIETLVKLLIGLA